MENNQQENIIKSIYKGRYEELDKIISKKIKENSNKIKDEEEKNNIKNILNETINIITKSPTTTERKDTFDKVM